jgi:hypothetical protein
MIEMLQNILEVMLEMLLVTILGVFGFSWDQPQEDTVDVPAEIEIVRLQIKSFDRLIVPVVSIAQAAATSRCADANSQPIEMPTVLKSEVSAFIT